ncbi:hypothetical protein [uncultured Mitsuokella sp.]|uniref:hypothetical protein n=1 Tax=uncultured Mitsuokella sp. TaxID=453120 RepID=UPI00260E4B17|nr:hypothetical protein [uncultured Mitsuokella sp.]
MRAHGIAAALIVISYGRELSSRIDTLGGNKMDKETKREIMLERIAIFCDADKRSVIKDAEKYAPTLEEIYEVLHG